MDYKTVILPNHILFEKDWDGWLTKNGVQASWSLNSNYIVFSSTEDLLAFRLVFGL